MKLADLINLEEETTTSSVAGYDGVLGGQKRRKVSLDVYTNTDKLKHSPHAYPSDMHDLTSLVKYRELFNFRFDKKKKK